MFELFVQASSLLLDNLTNAQVQMWRYDLPMRKFDLDWLATAQIDTAFRPISTHPLIILVGVTGVGKTTTVNALRSAEIIFDLLPNRRRLTDDLIIAHLQQQDGNPIQRITDRSTRFALTRRYRKQYTGGMAHALSQLWVCNDQPLLFDGLRGVNEIEYAVTMLPNARFLVLDAPHFVRLRRLLGRGDAFDAVAASEQPIANNITQLSDLGVAGVERLFSADEEADLIRLVNSGQLAADELASKLKIVSAERANYDPAATIQALQNTVPERTWLFDTSCLSPEEIAQRVKEKW